MAKYKCEKCGEKWKVRKTSGGRKKCQGEQCNEFLLPYKKEVTLIIYYHDVLLVQFRLLQGMMESVILSNHFG